MKIKKIYYVPGIITLLILPILVTNWTTNFIKENRNYCIELTLPDKSNDYYDTIFHKFYKTPANRDYKSIEINGKNTNNQDLLNNIKKAIEDITLKKDTINGLKIIFKEKANYNAFINIINSCLKVKAKTFIPISDTLYVYFINRGKFNDDMLSNVPQKLFHVFIDEVGCHNCLTFNTHEEYLKWKRNYLYNYWRSRFLEYSPIFICLLLMIILTFNWIYRFWKIFQR